MDMITLTIKDRRYGMRKMPPIKGAAFGARVANLVSKVLSDDNALPALESLQKRFLGKNTKENAKDEDLDGNDAMTFGQMIIRLLASIDPETINSIFREAFSWEVYYGSKRLSDDTIFEEHFSEFPGDLYIVAIWATFNHVKDFFTGLGDGLQALMASSGLKDTK